MKYSAIFLTLMVFSACKKGDTSNTHVDPVDSNTWYKTYTYVGTLKASGFFDILTPYTLDTTMLDTFYVTVIAKDSLLISRNYFSPNAVDGIFRRYTNGELIHLAPDSSYYHHQRHFIDTARLTSYPDALYWNNYNAMGGNGNVTSIFYGIKI